MTSRRSRVSRVFDVKRIYGRIRRLVRSNWIFYLIVLVYIVFASTYVILKNQAYLTSGFDLGLVNQAFSTTLFNHKLFYETGDLSFNPGGSYFGVHFSPILFLLLPFYAIYPSVENLLVMQTVILALGAFPVYWISRDKLGEKVGLLISVVYFIYPPLFLLNQNDFHLEAFTSTFFIFSVYYLEKEEWTKSLAFFVLAMLTIEFAPIVGVFVALYALLLLLKKRIKGRRTAQKFIIVAILVSILMFALALKTKETFNTFTSPIPSPFHDVLSGSSDAFAVVSSNWSEKVLYVVDFFVPLAFLPLLAPAPLIMALPWILASFATNYQPYYSVYFQYTGFVIPFVLAALPKAMERLKLQNKQRVFYVIFLSTIIFALYLPLGQGITWNYRLPTADERVGVIQKMLTLIPSNASVLTENDIFPHVSNRAEAYMYMPNSTNVSVDYILVDQTSQWYKWQQPPIFGERNPPGIYAEEVLQNGTFGILASAKNITLLEKGYTGEPTWFEPYIASFNYENLTLDHGLAIEDPTSSSGRVFFSGGQGTNRTFWHGPYAALPFGLYKVTFVMKVDRTPQLNQSEHVFTVDASASSAEVWLARRFAYGMDVPPNGGWFNVTMVFGLTAPTEGVEFRCSTITKYAKVYFDYLVIEQLSPQPVWSTELAFDSTDSAYISKESIAVFDGAAIVHLIGSPGTLWKGTLRDGPYGILPKGNYAARFWLRLDKSYAGPLLDVKIAKNSRTVYGSDFNTTGEWQSFEIKFTLDENSVGLEFSGVNTRASAPVSFLFVELSTDNGGQS